MIDEVDRRVRDWMLTVLDGTQVILSKPGVSENHETGVSLYLLEIVESPPPRTNSRTPLQFALLYLVTTWSQDVEQAHRWLGELLFAAMEHPEFEVNLDPPPPELWAGFGVAPCPSFRLKVPCRRARRQARGKPVMQPLVIQQSPVRPLSGQVLGPGDVPVMGARIEIPGLGQHTRTDAQGRFYFSRVPSDPAPTSIRVEARGQELQVDPSPAWEKEETPLLIRFELTEV